MDIREIKEEYFNGNRYKKLRPTMKRYAENYIVDANLTIKENRELVKKLNEAYRKQVEQINKENVDKLNLFTEDVVEYIVDEYHFNKAQAKAIELQVCSEYHDCMYEYFNEIDEVCSWVREILDMN